MFLLCRTCVEPPPVTLLAWLMLAPCVTPGGAALWSKTTAYLQPSPQLMSLVSGGLTSAIHHSIHISSVMIPIVPECTWTLTDKRAFVKDAWHLVPSRQDMCSTCRTTTWRPVRTCLGNCRTTTWCLPRLFRSTVPVPGHPAVLPSSLNFWTVGMVSFCDLWPLCLTANGLKCLV